MKLQILTTFGAILFHVTAIPLQDTKNALEPRDNTTVGISEALLGNFKLFANFTSASYCPNNENATAGTPITCPPTVCPLVEADSATTIHSFGFPNDTSLTNIKGYVALDPVRSLVVLAFAGSGATIRNWLTDFTFVQTPSSLCAGCYVHSGFALGWAERRVDILASIKSTLASGDYSLVVTGHSIGAAVATLAATELRNSGYELDLYTYGSPLVGNEAFAEYVSVQGTGNYRMTHLNDPVPQLPPTWLGYEHTSPEYWLSDGSATTEDYGAGDVVLCEGIGNTECNYGTGLIPIDGEAHNHYLGLVSACQGPLQW